MSIFLFHQICFDESFFLKGRTGIYSQQLFWIGFWDWNCACVIWFSRHYSSTDWTIADAVSYSLDLLVFTFVFFVILILPIDNDGRAQPGVTLRLLLHTWLFLKNGFERGSKGLIYLMNWGLRASKRCCLSHIEIYSTPPTLTLTRLRTCVLAGAK